MGILDHLICLLRNLYAGHEAAVRTGHGTMDWFKIRKGVCQGCIFSPTYLTFMQVHHEKRWDGWSMSWNQDCGEKYQKSQTCRWHHPYGRKQRGIKEPFDDDDRGEGTSWLKTQHSKMKIMVSGPITSWQMDGETVETVIDFIFGGLQNHCRLGLQPWN